MPSTDRPAIDFTQWTPEQLEVGKQFTNSTYHAEVLAEIDRRNRTPR